MTNKYDKPNDSLTTLAGMEAAYLPDLRRQDCESEEIKLTFTESVKLMGNETIIVHRRENDQSTQNPEKRKQFHLQ